jgi:hypothetical protein
MTSQLQQYEDMFNDHSNRVAQAAAAANSQRGYIGGMGGANNGMMRNSPRNFDSYNQQTQTSYMPEEYATMRGYETQRVERSAPQGMYGHGQSPAGFNTFDNAQAWGQNANAFGSATMGPPSRSRTQARRGVLPSVSFHLRPFDPFYSLSAVC